MNPEDRDLLLQFLWTRDETDAIGTPEQLREWLAGLGLLDSSETVSDGDVRLARHFRAAMRSLCAAHNGYPVDPRTAECVDEINALAPLKVTIPAGGGLAVEAGGRGVPRALSTLLAIAYKATAAGEFGRFKTCKGCGWAFYDETKNASRKWCDMGLCGTRSKMRAYRERKKAGA